MPQYPRIDAHRALDAGKPKRPGTCTAPRVLPSAVHLARSRPSSVPYGTTAMGRRAPPPRRPVPCARRRKSRGAAHPESVLPASFILDDLINGVAEQAVARRIPRNPAIPYAQQPIALRAEPKRAVRVRQDGPDALIAELREYGSRRNFPSRTRLSPPSVPPADRRCDPPPARERCRRRGVFEIKRLHGMPVPAAESAARGDPDLARAVLEELANVVGSQARPITKTRAFSFADAEDSLVQAAQPFDALPIHVNIARAEFCRLARQCERNRTLAFEPV